MAHRVEIKTMNTNAIVNDEIDKTFKVSHLEDLMNYRFKEYIEIENDELALKLAGALPVNIEKEFVPRYVFDIVLKSVNQYIGFLTLRVALTKKLLIRGGHIGYEIDQKYRGHNYTAKSIILLKPFIKSIINKKILVTCDEDNLASRKTIEKIGGRLIKIEQIEVPEEKCKMYCCYYEAF